MKQLGYFPIHFFLRNTFRKHIRQHHRASAQCRIAPRHEIYCRQERQIVARISVVNQLATVHAVCHIHPRARRSQSGKTRRHRFKRLAKAQQHGKADNGIVDIGNRRERNADCAAIKQIGEMNRRPSIFARYRRNEKRSVRIDTRPADFLPPERKPDNRVANDRVVSVKNHIIALARQPQFLATLLLQRRKSLLMFLPDICHHRNGRADYLLEQFHFVGMRYAGFDDRQIRIFVNIPYRQRHPDLRIVAARAAHNVVIVAQQLIQPFLHNRLSAAARYAYHRYVEPMAMVNGKLLQCFHRVFNDNDVCFHLRHIFGLALNHEIPDALRMQLPYVAMPVVAIRPYRKKQGSRRVGQRARIRQQSRYRIVAPQPALRTGMEDVGYFKYRIIHHRTILLRQNEDTAFFQEEKTQTAVFFRAMPKQPTDRQRVGDGMPI